MSHFIIAVLTNTGTEAEVTKLLAPYHQYECTGIDDQYVQNVDITEEARAEYDAGDYADMTFSQFIEREYGKQGVEVGKSVGPSAMYAFGYYTYVLTKDGQRDVVSLIRRTNPNCFWDYWTIGGRWGNLIPGNKCKSSELPTSSEMWGEHAPDGNRFFGVVTPDGKYHSKGRGGWFGTVYDASPDWTQLETELLEKYPDTIAVVVDFHI